MKSRGGVTWMRFALPIVLAASMLAGPAHSQSEPPQQPPSGGRVGADYLIGPGDSLNVFVWRQEELSVQVPVRPDGRISTPLVEDMVAVGKTPTELATDIENVLSEFIRSPEVTIIVENFVGALGEQVRVLGQVVNPGTVSYRERMTVLDVILEVGGLTDFASGNRSKLVRAVDGQTQERRLRLDDLLEDGDLDENLVVQPGDVIVVPEAIF